MLHTLYEVKIRSEIMNVNVRSGVLSLLAQGCMAVIDDSQVLEPPAKGMNE